jgi:hypothetical protein
MAYKRCKSLGYISDNDEELYKLRELLRTIKRLNDFDVDVLLSHLFHNIDSSNIDGYRNALCFMKNRLNLVLGNTS